MSQAPTVHESFSSANADGRSPADEARARLQRIRSQKLPTNSFISLADAGALDDGSSGDLSGLMFAAKDNINVAGMRTTCGSRIMQDYLPARDAHIVKVLKDAGAVWIGKTNMHEFALGATNTNPWYGDVRNPWDLERIPGGSSGGSATAVATGEVDVAIGTDSGGSVRIPAAMCGIVGFKPTGGSVSLDGIEGAAWTIDNIGIFTRTMDHCRRTWSQLQPPSGESSAARAPRLAYLKDDSMGVVSPAIWNVYTDTIAKLEQAGHDLTGISLPGFEQAPFVCVALAYPEISVQHARWIRERAADYSDDIRPLIRIGEMLGARHYATAQRARSALQRKYAQLTAGFDAVLMPTLALQPPRLHEPAVVPGDTTKHTLFVLMRFTVLFNAIGYPAVSIPAGLDLQSLPVGLEIVGLPGADHQLLAIAEQLETTIGWQAAPPVRLK